MNTEIRFRLGVDIKGKPMVLLLIVCLRRQDYFLLNKRYKFLIIIKIFLL